MSAIQIRFAIPGTKPRLSAKANLLDPAYLANILAPQFHYSRSGLFLHGHAPHGIVSPPYVRKHGRFTAEGLNNHVHLSDLTPSPSWQLEFGLHAVRGWIAAIRALPSQPERAVIYLHGSKQFSICAYSLATHGELAALEARLVERPFQTKSAASFLKWLNARGAG